MKRNKDVSSHTCSPSFWGRAEHKNRDKRVKWKRINEGDYSGESQESWCLTLKASFLSFSAQRDGVMEGWRRVLVPWRSLSFPSFSSLSDDEAEELSISFSHGLRPSVSLHLLSFPLRISPVVLFFSPPFVSGGRITCFSNHPSNVIRLKHAAHLAFNHFPLVIWSTLSFSSFVLFYPINKKQPWHFKIKQSLPVLHFHIIQS